MVQVAVGQVGEAHFRVGLDHPVRRLADPPVDLQDLGPDTECLDRYACPGEPAVDLDGFGVGNRRGEPRGRGS